MKKVLALLVAAACALPVAIGAQTGDNAKMVQMFSAQSRTGWGNLQVIVLNDRTVEALFGTSPAKAAFRTKARMTSVFFVQGTANKEFELKPDVAVVQKGETVAGKVTSMKNFAGGKVAKGEMVQGLVELPKKIDLFEPFKVTVGGDSVDFRLNADDVRDYGNR
ncbi:MAG: hypothetical protein EHM55_02435 [Acidobacteria bacterium]|nr:MAG: hypothetical protein EHM55_02435 [Acidobacteriota bacterium]